MESFCQIQAGLWTEQNFLTNEKKKNTWNPWKCGDSPAKLITVEKHGNLFNFKLKF